MGNLCDFSANEKNTERTALVEKEKRSSQRGQPFQEFQQPILSQTENETESFQSDTSVPVKEKEKGYASAPEQRDQQSNSVPKYSSLDLPRNTPKITSPKYKQSTSTSEQVRSHFLDTTETVSETAKNVAKLATNSSRKAYNETLKVVERLNNLFVPEEDTPNPADKRKSPPVIIPLRYEIVESIINRIEQLEGLKEEGIYRISGNFQRIRDIYVTFDTEPNFEGASAHDLAAVLKYYLKRLPTPLIPFENYGSFISLMSSHINPADEQQIVISLKMLLNELPDLNLQCLKLIIQHLHQVIQYPENLMTSENLGIVFGPTLLRTEPLDFSATCHENSVIALFVSYYSFLFEDKSLGRPKTSILQTVAENQRKSTGSAANEDFVQQDHTASNLHPDPE